MELNNSPAGKDIRYAKIKAAYSFQDIPVAISSLDKPDINVELLDKWQNLIDLMAKIIGVPSGLITRLSEKQLEVFLTNKNPENLFQPQSKFDLGLGWYCETVAGSRKQLVVNNAIQSEAWKNNPSVEFNMIAYMGMPILWPDGEVFGTFCVLDNKENQFSEEYKELLKLLLEIIENDLRSSLVYEQVKNDIIQKEIELREVHHCIKNQFNLLLSTIYLQSHYKQHDLEMVIADIQSRIKSISLLHDKLCHSVNMKDLSLWEYLNELGNFIIQTMTTQKIEFICESDPIVVSSRVSINCGLMLNELITNSIKYAFKNIATPKISLAIKKTSSSQISFCYKDNGAGLEGAQSLNNPDSLGTKFLEQEVKQLEGSYEITSHDGFEFKAALKV